MIKTIFSLILFLIFNTSFAKNIGSETGLELPRYVSLKSNDSNIRVGPSKNYPISIKYIVNDFPLKIVDEYEDWRKIIDFQNNKGWIHKSLIKGERTGIIISPNKNKINIYNTVLGKLIGEISTGSVIHLDKCKIDWCLIYKNNFRGWIKKSNIWGVKDKESFNIGFFQIFTDYYFKSINFIEKYIT